MSRVVCDNQRRGYVAFETHTGKQHVCGYLADLTRHSTRQHGGDHAHDNFQNITMRVTSSQTSGNPTVCSTAWLTLKKAPKLCITKGESIGNRWILLTNAPVMRKTFPCRKVIWKYLNFDKRASSWMFVFYSFNSMMSLCVLRSPLPEAAEYRRLAWLFRVHSFRRNVTLMSNSTLQHRHFYKEKCHYKRPQPLLIRFITFAFYCF